jgi:hypothetical protein
MKNIIKVIAVLCVLAIAIIGCLFIFGVIQFDVAISNLVKVLAAVALLGGCAAIIAALMRNN